MLIKVILVIKNSSSSSFPLLSCFFPPNTRFSLLKTLFCPSKLNTSHLHSKKIFKLHCQVCKNKRAFLEGKPYLCKVIRQNWLRFGKIRHFPHGFSTDNARPELSCKSNAIKLAWIAETQPIMHSKGQQRIAQGKRSDTLGYADYHSIDAL